MSATAFQRLRREAALAQERAKEKASDKETETTVNQIKEALDKKGIPYDSKAKKQELLKLLEGAE